MAGNHEKERERDERGSTERRSPRASLMWGAQQAQRSVYDSHNTSSCFALSLFFWGFLVPLFLSLFLLLKKKKKNNNSNKKMPF
jgi:hypothetical protein